MGINNVTTQWIKGTSQSNNNTAVTYNLPISYDTTYVPVAGYFKETHMIANHEWIHIIDNSKICVEAQKGSNYSAGKVTPYIITIGF